MSNNEPTNLLGLFRRLQRAPEGDLYKDLITLLEFRLSTVKDQLVEASDADYKKLQGRAAELREMLTGLRRIPVKKQKTGSYGS